MTSTPDVTVLFQTTNPNVKLFSDRYLILKTIEEEDAQLLDNCIYNTNNSQVVVFSPLGNLYFTTLNTDGTLNSNYKKIIKNPITNLVVEQADFLDWNPINYQAFSDFNSSITWPQFFVSLPMLFENTGSIGSGYILYRDMPYTGTNNGDGAKYLLMYNPYGRNNAINNMPTAFSRYCKTIQFQDPSCYCRNDPSFKCVSAFAGSDANGNIIKNLDLSNVPPEGLIAYNSILANCGCNSTCQNWIGLPTLVEKPNCSTVNQSVICGVNISATEESQLKTRGIKINQRCKSNSNNDDERKTSKDNPPEPEKGLSYKIIFLIIVVVLFLLGTGAYFLNKYLNRDLNKDLSEDINLDIKDQLATLKK